MSGDRKDWQSRAAAGVGELVKNAKRGVRAMPPMGTCTDCSDDELTALIESMLPAEELRL